MLHVELAAGEAARGALDWLSPVSGLCSVSKLSTAAGTLRDPQKDDKDLVCVISKNCTGQVLEELQVGQLKPP